MTNHTNGCNQSAPDIVTAAGSMLTLTLEIEGLVMLLQRRGDLVNPEVADLLRQKVEALAQLAGAQAVPASQCESDAAVMSEASAIASAAIFEETEDALPEADARQEEAAEEAMAPEHDETPSADVRQQPQVAFTLNDKFRFRRELFADSDADFQAAVSAVSSMTSAAEIEEYLTDDFCLDPQNPTVAEFIAVLTERL